MFWNRTFNAQENHNNFWIVVGFLLPFIGTFGTFQHFHLHNNNNSIYKYILLL